MEWLVWIGAAFTCLGLVGLGWCINMALRAKREETDEERLRARLQSVVAVNLAALGVSAIGLMMVILGVWLS